jgi:hypothetical protein
MGKIKNTVAYAMYKVAPKSVKKKMDATLSYKTSKHMESYYAGAAQALMPSDGLDDGAQLMMQGRAQELRNPARSGIPRKKARKIDASKDLQKENAQSWKAGYDTYKNQNLSPRQFKD